MEKWRIDVFSKDGNTRAFFNDKNDAIRYATNVAKRNQDVDIFLLENIFEDKYGNINQLYEGKEV